MIGPPTGVVPIDSSEYSEFTRPRISGRLTSWMVAVIIDMNTMNTMPVDTSAGTASHRLGDAAVHSTSTPMAVHEPYSRLLVGAGRVATSSDPSSDPKPIDDDRMLYVPASPWKTTLASSGPRMTKLPKQNIPTKT